MIDVSTMIDGTDEDYELNVRSLFLKYIVLESVRGRIRNVKQNNVYRSLFSFSVPAYDLKMEAAGFSETSELNCSNTEYQNSQVIKNQH
jgi:hypothetical protein